jgi:predicted nucleic acid-binding protein
MTERDELPPTFVDTNVFVYARDAAEPVKQRAALDWLQRLWQQRVGRTSMQALNEYYVTVTRKLRPGLPDVDAWDDVTALCAWNPQVIDRDVMTRARGVQQRHGTSWWDSTIVAAAQHQGCVVLLSEDFQAGVIFGSLTVQNPFANEVAEDGSAYATPTRLVPRPRHRPRGRPAAARRR